MYKKQIFAFLFLILTPIIVIGESGSFFPSCKKIQDPNQMCGKEEIEDQNKKLWDLAQTFELFNDIKQRALIHAKLNKAQAQFNKQCFINPSSNTICNDLISKVKNQISELLPEMRLSLSLIKAEKSDDKVTKDSPITAKATINIKHIIHGLENIDPLTPDEIEKIKKIRSIEEGLWVNDYQTTDAQELRDNITIQINNILGNKKLSDNSKNKKIQMLNSLLKQELEAGEKSYLAMRRRNKSASDVISYNDHYFNTIKVLPLLLHLKSANPNNEEIANGYHELEKRTNKVIASLEETDVGNYSSAFNLMFHTQIIDDILKNKPHLCYIAETLRKKYENGKENIDVIKSTAISSLQIACLGITKSGLICVPLSSVAYLLSIKHNMLNYNENADKILSYVDTSNMQALNLDDMDYEDLAAKLMMITLAGRTIFYAPTEKAGRAVIQKASKMTSKISAKLTLKTATKPIALKAKIIKKISTKLKSKDNLSYIPSAFSNFAKLSAKRFAPIKSTLSITKKIILPGKTALIKYLSATSNIATNIAIFTGVYQYFSNQDEKNDKSEIYNVIDDDYFFSDIKEMKQNNELSENELITEAIRRKKSYNAYYKWIDAINQNTLDYNDPQFFKQILADEILSYRFAPIFDELRIYLTDDFWKSSEFKFNGKKELTSEKTQKLFEALNKKIILYNTIEQNIFKQKDKNKEMTEFLNYVPMKKISNALRNREIDQAKANQMAKEVLYWYSKKDEYNALNVTPLKDGNTVDIDLIINEIITNNLE